MLIYIHHKYSNKDFRKILTQPNSYNSIAICKTISGKSTGKECVFPFKFNGKIYNYCIKSQNPKYTNKLWCPTKLNEKGSGMYSQTHWGWCSSKCPNEESLLTGIQSGNICSTIHLCIELPLLIIT